MHIGFHFLAYMLKIDLHGQSQSHAAGLCVRSKEYAIQFIRFKYRSSFCRRRRVLGTMDIQNLMHLLMWVSVWTITVPFTVYSGALLALIGKSHMG